MKRELSYFLASFQLLAKLHRTMEGEDEFEDDDIVVAEKENPKRCHSRTTSSSADAGRAPKQRMLETDSQVSSRAAWACDQPRSDGMNGIAERKEYPCYAAR